MTKKKPGAVRGGPHNKTPDELKRKGIFVRLDPKTLAKLEPFTETNQRGKVLDKAVEYLFSTHPDYKQT